MKHFWLENYIWGFVRVVFCEFQLKLEKSSFPWSSFDTLDDSFPFKEIALERSGADAFVLLFFDFLEVFEESALGWAGHFKRD